MNLTARLSGKDEECAEKKNKVGVCRKGTDLKEVHHVIGAGLQVDASDGHVLPGGPVSSQVHRHEVIQASA